MAEKVLFEYRAGDGMQDKAGGKASPRAACHPLMIACRDLEWLHEHSNSASHPDCHWGGRGLMHTDDALSSLERMYRDLFGEGET